MPELKIEKLSRDIYQTKINGSTVDWLRYGPDPRTFNYVVRLDLVLNHGVTMYVDAVEIMSDWVVGAHMDIGG